MSVTEPQAADRRPRAIARRRQITEAAATCFRRDGFHAASMAEVAREAGMSVGHIYRYFSGKEEIIAAIVRDQLDVLLSRFPVTAASPAEVPRILRENAFDAARQAADRDRSVLMLEVRAEAGRNPRIAAIVQAADEEIIVRVRGLVRSAFAPAEVPVDLDRRLEMIGVVIEGITFRAVSLPLVDPEIATGLLELIIDHIFGTDRERVAESAAPQRRRRV